VTCAPVSPEAQGEVTWGGPKLQRMRGPDAILRMQAHMACELVRQPPDKTGSNPPPMIRPV